ncbi:DNA-binding response regulator [bacterium]|nr:DNA-binding response regulator [bacterium]
MKIRILLIDDHPVLRAGLSNLLKRQKDFEVVGMAGTGEAALEMFEACRPDVCLLDLTLPGMDGFEVLNRMRRMKPEAHVIVLTSSDSADDAARAIDIGASGFISKNVDHREIMAAIRDVHGGRTGIYKGIAAIQPASDDGPLTPRELEVLVLMREGFTNATIGRKLSITERTVKWHVTLILEKLGAFDRASAVAKGFDLGLLKTSPPAGR